MIIIILCNTSLPHYPRGVVLEHDVLIVSYSLRCSEYADFFEKRILSYAMGQNHRHL